MKFVSIVAGILLFCMILFSCEKNTSEYFDHTVDDTSFCKRCAYIPRCDSSRYYYLDSSSGGPGYKNIYIAVLGDTSINGVNYTRLNLSGKIVYDNCSGGTTTEISYASVNGVITEMKNVVLKANESINATWQDVFNSNGLTTTCNYKIITRSMNRNVLGRDYSDVTQVHKSVTSSSAVFGVTPVSEEDYFYSRGIGLIEYESKDALTDSLILLRRLQQYQIP